MPNPAFWPFLAVNNVFLWVFKNTDQNNICVSTFLKAKTEEKLRKKKMVDPQKRAFLSFEIKKTVNKIFFIFFVCSSFNNKRLTNVMLISIF